MQRLSAIIKKNKITVAAVFGAVLLLILGLFLDFSGKRNEPQSENISNSEYSYTSESAISSEYSEISTDTVTEAEKTEAKTEQEKSTKPTEAEKTTQSEKTTSKATVPVSQPGSLPSSTEPPKTAGSCTVSISCATILDNMDKLKQGKAEIVPRDGWILKPVRVGFAEGETVFDVLKRVCRENGIPLEYSFNPMYNSAYIEGIANIYEFDAGKLSGWQYRVDGAFVNYGCSLYKLKDSQKIEWLYTCNLGGDIEN